MGGCSSAPILPNQFAVDLSHFEEYRTVGRGGFGVVNAAVRRDRTTGKLVTDMVYAIKQIPKWTMLKNQAFLDTVWMERYVMMKTVSVTKSLFIVPLYWAFQSPTDVFFVLPFMHGGSLEYQLDLRKKKWNEEHHGNKLIQSVSSAFFRTSNSSSNVTAAKSERVNHAPQTLKATIAGITQAGVYAKDIDIETKGTDLIFSENEACFYAAQVLLALDDLHSVSLVCRDLKPGNILLDRNGNAKLSDFGLAQKLYEEDNWETGGKIGTPGYMAPEIVKRKRYSFEIDIWMLGILIFELLHGRKPWVPFEETSNGRDNAMAAGRSGESVASDMKSLEAQVNEYFSNLNEKLSKQLSANCVNLLQNLLTIDPSKRLGSSDDGWLDVMKHPWFTGIDWNKMRSLEVPAPLKPNTGKGNFSEDVEYDDLFDPPIPRRIDPKDQELFLDFEYHTKIFDPSEFTKKLSNKGRGGQGGVGVQGSTENKFAPGQQLELETEGLVDSASFIDGVNTPSTLSPSTSFVKGDLGSIRFGQESPSNAFS